MSGIDRRTVLAVLLILAFAHVGLGRELPVDTSSPLSTVGDIIFFAAYLYLFRTLVRLPFAILITLRHARHVRDNYGLNNRESLRDGFIRGFLDARRWTTGQLAMIDRLTVFISTMFSTLSGAGTFLVRLGGMFGLAMLIMLYLFRGSFSFLVDDNLRDDVARSSGGFPFLKTRD